MNQADILPTTSLAVQSAFETEIATLIVGSLQLEMDASDIAPQAPLFNEGLGLDSIDALELGLALSRAYGLELKSDDPNIKAIFATLRSLAAHVETHRTR